MTFKTISEHTSFGGRQLFMEHDSREIGLPMRLSVYLPPQATQGPVPALMYLAGLTCNEETFMTKAGAQRHAAKLGLALIAPDTSPRGANLPGDSEGWDFGVGAGFYLDAIQAPWSQRYRMESYLTAELLPLLFAYLPINGDRVGIFGHSMGGHGALTLALRHPGQFKSGLGVCTHLRAHAMPLGPQGVHRLSGHRYRHMGSPRQQPVDGDAHSGTLPGRHPD